VSYTKNGKKIRTSRQTIQGEDQGKEPSD